MKVKAFKAVSVAKRSNGRDEGIYTEKKREGLRAVFDSVNMDTII
jgi:hypothetical protein